MYLFLYMWCICEMVNTLRPSQNGRHFADDTFKRIFLNENVGISIKISLKFVPKGPINNIPALVQLMAWRRPGDKPLTEPMVVKLLTHICVTLPQWVNALKNQNVMYHSFYGILSHQKECLPDSLPIYSLSECVTSLGNKCAAATVCCRALETRYARIWEFTNNNYCRYM